MDSCTGTCGAKGEDRRPHGTHETEESRPGAKAAHREAEERRLADERRLAAAPPKPDVGSPPETKPAPAEPETKPKPPTWDFNTPQPKEPDAASDVLSRYRR